MFFSVSLCLRGELLFGGRADTAKQNQRTTVERATDGFLRHLRERNASAHTIKAYTGDLDAFAAYVGARRMAGDRPHRHPRFSLPSLRQRTQQDFRRPRSGRGSIALSLAGAGRRGRAESRQARLHAAAAQETAARSDHRRSQFRARRQNAGSRFVPRARPADARITLRLRHSQLGTGRHQPRRHSHQQRSHPDSRQRKEGTLCSVRRIGQRRTRRLPALAARTAGHPEEN